MAEKWGRIYDEKKERNKERKIKKKRLVRTRKKYEKEERNDYEIYRE